MNSLKIRSFLLLLLAAVIWGTAFVAQSAGMDYVGPFAFNGARTILGGLVLLPVILIRNGLRKKDGESKRTAGGTKTLWLGGLCCGLFLCAAANMQQIGIQYTSVGKAGFLTACYIIIVPVIGMFFGKKSSPMIWAAVGLAVAGLYLLCITGKFSISAGDRYVLICAFLFAGHILVVDHFSPLADGITLSCIQFFVSGLLSILLMLIFEPGTTMTALLAAWKPIAYAGILSSGLGYTFQIVGQKGLNPTVASLIMSLESCIAVLAGWLILHQAMSRREILGCCLMFAAILLAQLPARTGKSEKDTKKTAG